jgi:acetyltransferase-like isoleucine patch superfamily enzyme
MGLSPELERLRDDLVTLHHALREQTRAQYDRINPFTEDLFDWKERGAFVRRAGDNVTIYNSTTVVGDVAIGANTWIGPFCSLDGTGGLSIGAFCSISLGCQLLTHDTVRWALSGGAAPHEYAPTRIGDCCFLGSHAVVVKGVTIGDRCVVGAGAVVTRDVPDLTIVTGVPARPTGTVHVEGATVRLQTSAEV